MFVRIGDRDLEVVVHDPAATDADLARAAGLPIPVAPRPLAALGLRAGDCPLAGSGDETDQGAVTSIAVVGGPDAGHRVPLPPGGVVGVGRSSASDLAIDDPAVSRDHACLAADHAGCVAVVDDGSRNGTWVGEPQPVLVTRPRRLEVGASVRIGRTRFRADVTDHGDRPVGGLGRPGPGGRTPHNRPPRVALPAPPEAVAVPLPPQPAGARVPLGVVAVLGPLVTAGGMVWLLGSPAFALLALLSPVLAIGAHVEGRRRDRKGSRRDAAAWAAAIAGFRRALADAAAVEVARLRASAADPAEVVRRAVQPSTALWERRPSHADWLVVRLGTGDLVWQPPLRDGAHGPRHPDAAAALAAEAVLGDAPVTVALAGGGAVGLVGLRPIALAVARCLLVQLAVHQGPSDLEVLIACDEAAVPDWEWAKWLPHVDDATGGPRRLAVGRAAADALATARLDRRRAARAGRAGHEPEGATMLAVVDGDELLAGRRAPLRALLDGHAGPSAGIVVSASVDRLPSACTAVIVLADDGSAELRLPSTGSEVVGIDPDGLSVATATSAARALARFDDPELDVAGAGLPAVVSLLELLGGPVTSASAMAARWAAGGADPAPRGPVGVDDGGVVEVDLAADGPHVLVAGTTGAGKSELLRTLVAGLAAGSSPEHLTFLLVDFKGGSAFDACARLPHVVGLVTDLDAELAERALRCLEAELRHRERVLRAAGAADLAAYRAGEGTAPLPRLVVVVDEFATLKAELPDFVDALVGVAQRGRSLGVHLVLATQRPAGSVSDHIKANADLRVALRVQDAADSVDVLDDPIAATLPRARPGRACVRFGPGELLTVQTALATAGASADRPPIELRPFRFGPHTSIDPAAAPPGGPTDLDRLVDAAVAAFAASGRPPPRRPWPEPLPTTIEVDALEVDYEPGTVVVGIADDPDRQEQRPAGWRPADGNLLVFGVGRSGTTTTLLALARALAAGASPAALQLYGLDLGAGDLALLSALPHAVAVVAAGERERQQRLVRHLRTELDRRKAMPSASERGPEVVLLVDGLGRFLADFDDLAGMEVVDTFTRVFTDGPEVGIRVAATADRAGAVPAALGATVRQRWVHRLADAVDAAAVGVGVGVGVGGGPGSGARCTSLPPGRFLDVSSGLAVQVATPSVGWNSMFAAVADRWPTPAPAAPRIRALPDDVPIEELPSASVVSGAPWRIPIGIGDDDGPAVLTLHEGDHVLVAGPGRSGRTTALATVVLAVVRARQDAAVVAVAGRRSWLTRVPGVVAAGGVAAAAALVAGATEAGLPAVLLVDDAEGVDDVDGALERLVATDGVHVVAAGRADVLRGMYGHWTRTLRRSRLGVLLHPDPDLDGELLAATLPRRSSAPWSPGRGYLVVDGVPVLVQVARCKDAGP